MSPQKPIKRGYEQSAPVVMAWTYPGIAERAGVVVDTDVHGRGYAPISAAPSITSC